MAIRAGGRTTEAPNSPTNLDIPNNDAAIKRCSRSISRFIAKSNTFNRRSMRIQRAQHLRWKSCEWQAAQRAARCATRLAGDQVTKLGSRVFGASDGAQAG